MDVEMSESTAEGAFATAGQDGIFNETENEDGIYKDESKPEFIFENMTLDEIIQLKRSQDGNYARIPRAGIRYGTDDTSPAARQGISPVFMLKVLSEEGKLFEMEAKELEVGATNINDFRAHRWRVTWTHNKIEGIGEAPRKMMAKQVAALDLIEKMRGLFPDENLPQCYIPAGCLINPFVFVLLDDKCDQLGIGAVEFQHQITLTARLKKQYATICYIEDQVFVGRSHEALYAKRFAAKSAYEAITGMNYPNDKIIRGVSCFTNGDIKYNPIESEANHVYYVYKKPPTKRRCFGLGSSTSGSLNGSVTPNSEMNGDRKVLPPRLRPPPIIVPESVKIKLSQTQKKPESDKLRRLGRFSDELTQARKPPFVQDSGEVIEIDDPYKYGEYGDDDEEFKEFQGSDTEDDDEGGTTAAAVVDERDENDQNKGRA